MSKSIMQDRKVCYFTGSVDNLDKHHIFLGTANRKKSEQYGCWVWITHWLHMRIHQDHEFTSYRYELQKEAQRRFEAIYGHEKFMQEFHKNYL